MRTGPKGRPASLLAITTLLVTLLCIVPAWAQAAQARDRGEQIWLAVSDIHLDPFDRSARPSRYGVDSNVALFRSALNRMKRAVPNPAVVLIPGDFFVHHFAWRAGTHARTPNEGGIQTMRYIASALNSTFPRSQFAIALGNNDVPCGDYKSADGSAYLATVARIWAPLVDRGGAAPDFAASFARSGYYTLRLPLRGLRLVVLNTVLFSSRYAGNCGGNDFRGADRELAWLRATLRATPPKTRNLVMMHIPPGFDAISTDYLRGFLALPFLNARDNAAVLATLGSPGNRVAYAIAGHTHHFDFRLTGDVPIVVLGALSPIYRNNPTFYALRVAAGGSLRDVDFYSFEGRAQAWLPARSFDRTWGYATIDTSALGQLHARLTNDPAARVLWDRQADGWPSPKRSHGGAWAGKRWRVPWCAQTNLGSSFARCAGVEQREQILWRLIAAIAALIAISLLALFLRGRVKA